MKISKLEAERRFLAKRARECETLLRKPSFWKRLSLTPSLKSGLKQGASLEVVLMNRMQIKKLNSSYRKKSKATDVLSFPASTLFLKQGFLGSIAICYSIARAQAKEFGHSVQEELDLLLVHGVLHLLGFDHERSSHEAHRMKAHEEWFLSQLSSKAHRGLISRSA
jgi:probable rRNA maturation factor